MNEIFVCPVSNRKRMTDNFKKEALFIISVHLLHFQYLFLVFFLPLIKKNQLNVLYTSFCRLRNHACAQSTAYVFVKVHVTLL